MSNKANEESKDTTILFIQGNKVSCDGGDIPHPKVYLKVTSDKLTICPYCGKKFQQEKNNFNC